jgi:hypothetical protein
MKIGIKVFYGIPIKTIQEQIDDWLEKEKPKEITFIAASESASNSEKDFGATVSRQIYVAYKK